MFHFNAIVWIPQLQVTLVQKVEVSQDLLGFCSRRPPERRCSFENE